MPSKSDDRTTKPKKPFTSMDEIACNDVEPIDGNLLRLMKNDFPLAHVVEGIVSFDTNENISNGVL
eukprot:scaffold1187_cov363-Pavlova_lutheri.AAC.3